MSDDIVPGTDSPDEASIPTQDPGRRRVPVPDADHRSTRPGLPAEALSTQKRLGRYPGRRNPRKGDLVLTIILSVVLYALVVQYVGDAITRGQSYRGVSGTQLANTLAVIAPIALAAFSTVFAIVFVLRRVYSFWLPIVAGVLVIALYSVTKQMLDQAVLNHLLP